MTKVVAIVSGGMDSVTLAYDLVAQGHELILLTFNYGQRHKVEIGYAEKCAKALNAEHRIIDLSVLTEHLKGSALTDDIDVPEGHYAADSMKATVVPNRNAIMLSIATGIAVAEKAEFVATGVHAGDHFIYPDCRPDFIHWMSAAMRIGNDGFRKPNFQILAPYVNIMKQDIVTKGAELNVPYADTWSCYKGSDKHCGKCGTCVERKEAFEIAGVVDPTEYEV